MQPNQGCVSYMNVDENIFEIQKLVLTTVSKSEVQEIALKLLGKFQQN